MLGRTAGGLFWMYRYLERAEYTTRLIDTGQRIAMTRAHGSDAEWESVLKTVSADAGYFEKHEHLSRDAVVDWMLRDTDNHASVLTALKQARDNARAVRTGLTHETWEAVNSSWMLVKQALSRKVGERDLPRVLGLIRDRTALVRGATDGTMLRNDIFNFVRLGAFIERADNTGRILDVKYYVLLPTSFSVGSTLDNAQWDTILRAVSGKGGFRLHYGIVTQPSEIVNFLVLDRRLPRSLRFCADQIAANLDLLAQDYGFSGGAQDQARALAARLDSETVGSIFDFGLHEYIQDILSTLAGLSRQIEIDYRFYA